MIKIIIHLVVTFIVVIFISGCTIVPPKIEMTGEKTHIERQIVGDYRELESDAWIVSSIKTSVQREESDNIKTTENEELYAAIKMREFNSIKLREYKSLSLIGEGLNGLVKYIDFEKNENNEYEKKVVINIINDENEARRIIFEKSVPLSDNKIISNKEIERFKKYFIAQQRELARTDDYIEIENGKWIRKK